MSREKCRDLLRKLSVLRAPPDKPFVLKSGKTSPYYVDVRLTSLNAEGLCELVSGLHWEVRKIGKPRYVAGVALGGCPLATGIAYRSFTASMGGFMRFNLPDPVINTLYVRSEAKEHGIGKMVEGKFEPGEHVVLVEDVITSGGSTLRAVEELRKVGLTVLGVVAVLDREEGGVERIRKECLVEALFTLKELVEE